jgi:hypothetical protein
VSASVSAFLSNNFSLVIDRSLLVEDMNMEGKLPATTDSDGDGLTDTEEELYNTDKLMADTDGDSYPDGEELINLYSPVAGNGAKLATSSLINIYTNLVYKYTVFHPAGWLARPLDETNQEALITSATGETIEIIIMDNPDNISIETWYRNQMAGMDIDELERDKIDGQDAVWSIDGQTLYTAYAGRIYSLTYHHGSHEKLNFKTTFKMMIKSFKFPKLSDLELQSQYDAMRLEHIDQIQSALEIYYQDHGIYPGSLITGESLRSLDDVYLPSIPANPEPGGMYYEYQVSQDDQSYELRFRLEVGAGDYDVGYYLATPGGISRE